MCTYFSFKRRQKKSSRKSNFFSQLIEHEKYYSRKIYYKWYKNQVIHEKLDKEPKKEFLNSFLHFYFWLRKYQIQMIQNYKSFWILQLSIDFLIGKKKDWEFQKSLIVFIYPNLILNIHLYPDEKTTDKK